MVTHHMRTVRYVTSCTAQNHLKKQSAKSLSGSKRQSLCNIRQLKRGSCTTSTSTESPSRTSKIGELQQGVPAEGADADHDHHGHQGSHGNLAHPRPQEHHNDEQEDARHEGGQTPAPTGLHVDDRLPDHGATGHAADETGA